MNKKLAIGLAALTATGLAILLWPSRPPTVLFVVLDTVRADHLSLCGYDRPTSPVLQSLAERGAAWTCQAVAPGSWTVPSHASFFTGLPVTEHGVHGYGGDPVRDEEALSPAGMTHGVFPMPNNLETLAEVMGARGYATASVSTNPLVSSRLRLTRGFEVVRAAKTFEEAYGDLLMLDLQLALRELGGRDDPLFLFVNIADAHMPWRGVPEGLGWVPPRPRLHYEPSEREGSWSRFVRGEMQRDEADALLAHATDAYDYSIWQADEALGRVLEALEATGAMDGDWRIVVTSDHGELLGEHGLLAHGYNVYEPNARVPLLYLSSDGAAPSFDGPISALHAYHLTRDGALPEFLAPVQSAAFPGASWARWSEGWFAAEPEAAVWQGDTKHVWRGGDWLRYDLGEDPGEIYPAPTTETAPALLELVQDMGRSASRKGDMDAATQELLRAVGYIE